MTTAEQITAVMKVLGKRGGKAYAKNTTPEQRKASASRAARARWATVRSQELVAGCLAR